MGTTYTAILAIRRGRRDLIRSQVLPMVFFLPAVTRVFASPVSLSHGRSISRPKTRNKMVRNTTARKVIKKYSAPARPVSGITMKNVVGR